MKKRKLFIKVLLLMALVGSTSVSKAEGTISIPQELGSYILIGTESGGTSTCEGISVTNCKIDTRLGDTTNNKYYTIGTTNSKTTIDFTIAPEAGSYVFGFKSGASGCASVVTVSLTKSGESTATYTKEETIANDGNWDPNIAHNFLLENLEAATYTLHIAVKSVTSGSYAGNFGNFYFHKLSQLTWGSSSSYVELSDGTFTNANDNSDNVVNYIKREGGSIDNILIYNEEASYRIFHFNIDSYKQASTVKVTVCDFSTGTLEAQETASITAAGSYVLPLSNQITAGLKTVRFDFADADETSDDSYLYNFRYVYFAEPSVLPIYGTAVLDLSQGSITSSSNPRYSDSNGTSNEFSYIYNGGSADSYYVYIDGSETAYYDLRTVTSNYNKGGTFKVTITDVATSTVEVNAQESAEITSNNQSIVMALSSALKPGIKKIRFDFVKENESSWLYNIKDICFLKRSLNESYDYTAVAATSVDVVLTRSITANKWSTICLPFAMTSDQITAAFGSGATVAELTNATAETLTFTTVTAMDANKPYAIKVATDFTSATISGVSIVNGTPSQTVNGWTFTGTYANGTIPNGSYFFSDNKLYKASGSGNTIKPFRAYFTYNGSAPARQVRFVIDGETTGIDDAAVNVSGNESNAAYDLQGRRVAQPRKGLYVIDGKKVVIK